MNIHQLFILGVNNFKGEESMFKRYFTSNSLKKTFISYLMGNMHLPITHKLLNKL